jgi:1-acyl-sn-glycerol-3-phosphate acyltransferase
MRSVVAWASLPFLTLVYGSIALVAALLGVRNDREGSVYDFAIRSWSRGLLWFSGVKVVLHGRAHLHAGRQIFVGNHLSRFDVLVLAAHLHRIRFVAKAELSRIPFFGRAAGAVGTIYIEREKRTSSLASLQRAAAQIGEGASVIMFPEGSRSPDYALRPFKKGPFVLAISAGVPIVPTVIHGTLHVHPKGEWRIRAGRVDVHFLEPVPVAGLTYADRDQLASSVRDRMAAFLQENYGS